MISLKGLHFSYRPGQDLFHDLELQLDGGSVYGLLGKNGAGKTSLLRLISGLLKADKGTCEVFGFNSFGRDPALLQELFFITEEFYLPRMTTSNYLRQYSPFYPDFDGALFDRLVEQFEIPGTHELSSLSFGQKKKFMLSFGLASNTRLLLLDEPTNGLDIPSKSQFRSVLAETISSERTVIISTHQVRDLASLMDPLLILDSGRILFNSSLEEISKRLEFRLMQQLDAPADALYAERIPGGYLGIYENTGSPVSEVDAEILFNAVISRESRVTELFNKQPTS